MVRKLALSRADEFLRSTTIAAPTAGVLNQFPKASRTATAFAL